MTKDEFFDFCKQAGFARDEDGCLSGRSEDDERAYVGEYPCGEQLLELTKLLSIEILDDSKRQSHHHISQLKGLI